MSSVELTGVSVRFDRPVVHDVDLSVGDGQTLALLGPSGSGKSTLLRVIAGLVTPDAGSVSIGSTVVDGVAPHRRGVGMVFQDQALFPHLTVGANVGFGLRMAKVSRPARRLRVDELLDLVGLAGYADRDPATLSGGEAQRVAIARALAPSPGVLLLDEPFAALDQLLRERLLTELRALFDRLAVTVIAVTHDPTEAGALGHQIAVLHDGQIAQIGPAGAVLAHPTSVAVAGLVGQRNVGAGRVVAGFVTTPWGSFPAPGRADGTVDVLIRPDGIRPLSAGDRLHRSGAVDVDGIVRSLLFRGGSAFATVATTGGAALDVRANADWQVGDRVTIRIDPDAVAFLASTTAAGDRAP